MRETPGTLARPVFASKHAVHRNESKENERCMFLSLSLDGPRKDGHAALWTNVFRSQQ